MSAVILIEADSPEFVDVMKNLTGENKVFSDAEQADQWLQKYAQVGWCTRIIEIED